MKNVFVFALCLVLLGLCGAASFRGKASSNVWKKANRETLSQGLQRRSGDGDSSEEDDGGLDGLYVLETLCELKEDMDGLTQYFGGKPTDVDGCKVYRVIIHAYSEAPNKDVVVQTAIDNNYQIWCLVMDMIDGTLSFTKTSAMNDACSAFGSNIVENLGYVFNSLIESPPFDRSLMSKSTSEIKYLLKEIRNLIHK